MLYNIILYVLKFVKLVPDRTKLGNEKFLLECLEFPNDWINIYILFAIVKIILAFQSFYFTNRVNQFSKSQYYEAIELIKVSQSLQHIVGSLFFIGFIARGFVFIINLNPYDDKECKTISWKYT